MSSFFNFTTDNGRFKYRYEFDDNVKVIYRHDVFSDESRYYCEGIEMLFNHFILYNIKPEWHEE